MSAAGAPPTLPLLILCVVPAALGLQCYVCVPRGDAATVDVLHVFPTFPANLTCEGFVAGRAYARECPRNYTSCVTLTDGMSVTRTCGEVPVDDCLMANKVEYCYCKDPLCNGQRAPSPARRPPSPPSDDEDLEGSGGGPTDGRRGLAAAAAAATTAPPAAATSRSAGSSGAGPRPHRTVLPALLVVAALFAWAY